MAQTHTPEESIVCEKALFASHALTISKSRLCNNPHSGDFSYKRILTLLELDHIADRRAELVVHRAQHRRHLSDVILQKVCDFNHLREEACMILGAPSLAGIPQSRRNPIDRYHDYFAQRRGLCAILIG